MKKTFPLFLILNCLFAGAQVSDSTTMTDTCTMQISLLTCTPGDELYSTFGHSAFRVVDPGKKTDIVFNYGTFDFNDPDFYPKFVQGKLLYFVSVSTMDDFLAEYEYYKRGVTEQVLDLSCAEKKNLEFALYENAKEENKYYLYDFTHDNCTTRLRDMIEGISGNQLRTRNILPGKHVSFRDFIHTYLDRGGQQWSKFGIDILLGSPLDRDMSNREAMFLPDYLLIGLDSTALHNGKLVKEKNTILPAIERPKAKKIFSPFMVMSIFLIVIAVLSFMPKAEGFLRVFDIFFFLLIGLLGLLILFMWFGTNHLMCRSNYNLLWALPTHIFFAPLILSRKGWVKSYFTLIFFYSLILFVAWFFLPQEMNNALLPIVGILAIRSFFISKKK